MTCSRVLIRYSLVLLFVLSANSSAYCQNFFLRANLLRWMTLTPSLGAEWQLTGNWSVIGDYTWGNYSFNHGDHRYAISEATAEIRHYLSSHDLDTSGFYLGLYGVAGNFNYKFTDTGRQGNHLGIGLSAGWQLNLSTRWIIDLGAAVGYLNVSKGERYRSQDNLKVWNEDFTKNTFAPLSLRATLVYNLFSKKGGDQ